MRSAPAVPTARRGPQLVVAAVTIAIAVAASVEAGLAVARGGPKPAVVLPLGIAIGVALLALAVARFELFVAAVILARASLDVAKVGTTSLDAPGAISGLFIATGLLWLLIQRTKGKAERSPLVAPLSALVVAGALSTVFSATWFESAIETVRIGTVVVILAVLNRLLVDWERIRLVLVAVFASSIVPLAVGAYQLVQGRGRYLPSGISRIEGTFLHPNPFGVYLFLLVVLGIALLPYLTATRRAMMGVLLLGLGTLLIGTYSRGAWIATFVGVVVVALFRSRRLVVTVAVAATLLVLLVPSVSTRFADLAESRRPSGAAGNSLAWRLEYWEEIVSLQTNPVFGIGLRGVTEDPEASKAPHNDFIRMYVETGVVGLFAYLWFLWAAIATAWRGAVGTPEGLARGLSIALAGCVAGFLLLSVAGNVISQLVILWYFGAIAATAVAATRLASRPSAAPV